MSQIIYDLFGIIWIFIAFRIWYILWNDTNTTKSYKIQWTLIILCFQIFGAIFYVSSDKTHAPIFPWGKK